MNKNDNIYDALSGIDEKYLARSEDFSSLSAQFRRLRIRTAEKCVSFAACIAVSVIVGLNTFEKNDVTEQSSMIKPSYQTTADIKHTMPESKSSQTTSSALKIETTVSSEMTSLTNDIEETSPEYYPVQSNDDYPLITETTSSPESAHTKPNVFVTSVTEISITETRSTNTSVSESRAESSVTETSGDMAQMPSQTTPKHWEDMSITEKYFSCDFDGEYYQVSSKAEDSISVGEYLGEAVLNGYDYYTQIYHHLSAKAYQIKNTPEKSMIAVKIENEDGFYVYVSNISAG